MTTSSPLACRCIVGLRTLNCERQKALLWRKHLRGPRGRAKKKKKKKKKSILLASNNIAPLDPMLNLRLERLDFVQGKQLLCLHATPNRFTRSFAVHRCS